MKLSEARRVVEAARDDATYRAVAVRRHKQLVRWLKGKKGFGLGIRVDVHGTVGIDADVFAGGAGPSQFILKVSRGDPTSPEASVGPRSMILYVLPRTWRDLYSSPPDVEPYRNKPNGRNDYREVHRAWTRKRLDAITDAVNNRYARASFVHEFVHWMDIFGKGARIRVSDPANLTPGSKRISPHDDLPGYMTSDHEYNAFFQQSAADLEQKIREAVKMKQRIDATGTDPERFLRIHRVLIGDRFPKSARDFVAWHTTPGRSSWPHNFVVFVMKSDKRRNFIKRLTGLHAHLNQKFDVKLRAVGLRGK